MTNSVFQDINLKTNRLTVRALRDDDVVDLHAVVSQPEVVKFLPEDVMSLEDVTEAIKWFSDLNRTNTVDKIVKWTLGIVWNETSKVIGWCGLGPLDFNPKETELYCGISASHWGQGVAAEACRALLDYAFNVMGLSQIVAVVKPENTQSLRLIEKLGMQYRKQVSGLDEQFKFYEGFHYYTISK